MIGGLALVGGVAVTPSQANAGSAPAADEVTFALHGFDLRTSGTRIRRPVGDSYLITGLLRSAGGGGPIGELHATATVVSSDRSLLTATHSIQTQTFILADGTLIGSGPLTHGGVGRMAITGGTGRYHRAQGSYTATHDVDSSAGGTAHYLFTIMPGRGAT